MGRHDDRAARGPVGRCARSVVLPIGRCRRRGVAQRAPNGPPRAPWCGGMTAVGPQRVWAPNADEVTILIDGERREPMQPVGGAWFEAVTGALRPGSRYQFVLDGRAPRPDPRSAWQPEGVH